MTPDKWLAALSAGDENAFDELYEHTHRAVFNIIYGVLRDVHAAEDAEQETYIAVFRKCSQYVEGTNALGWIYKIAKNTALNALKRNGRDLPTDFAEHDVFGSNEPSPEERADTPLTDLARKALKEDEYEILMLCDVSGYKRREVAQMLDIPLPTVTWKRNKAIKILREAAKGADIL